MKGNFISNCEKRSEEGLMEMRRRPVVNEWANDCELILWGREAVHFSSSSFIITFGFFKNLRSWFTVYFIYAFLPGGSVQCIPGCSLLLHMCQWLRKLWTGKKCCFVSLWMALRCSEYNYWHLDTTGRDSCKPIEGNSCWKVFMLLLQWSNKQSCSIRKGQNSILGFHDYSQCVRKTYRARFL